MIFYFDSTFVVGAHKAYVLALVDSEAAVEEEEEAPSGGGGGGAGESSGVSVSWGMQPPPLIEGRGLVTAKRAEVYGRGRVYDSQALREDDEILMALLC